MGFSYGAAANSYALAAGLGMTPAALSAAAGSAALRGDTHQLAALLAAGQDVGALNGFPGLNAAGSSNNMQVRARFCAVPLRLGLFPFKRRAGRCVPRGASWSWSRGWHVNGTRGCGWAEM